MLKDSISRFWLCKRVESEMGYQCVLPFVNDFFPTHNSIQVRMTLVCGSGQRVSSTRSPQRLTIPCIVCIFSQNHIGTSRILKRFLRSLSFQYASDYPTVIWAVHRLGAILTFVASLVLFVASSLDEVSRSAAQTHLIPLKNLLINFPWPRRPFSSFTRMRWKVPLWRHNKWASRSTASFPSIPFVDHGQVPLLPTCIN
jgi:hypothetical protein